MLAGIGVAARPGSVTNSARLIPIAESSDTTASAAGVCQTIRVDRWKAKADPLMR